ncbi:MAG: hypothetical protein NTY19_05460 [Planctomycetota bacterium]|nr:hypothetical protein [Planctomycetota bacterium]
MRRRKKQIDCAGVADPVPPAQGRVSLDSALRRLGPLPAPDRRWQVACQSAQAGRDPLEDIAADLAEAAEYSKSLTKCTTDAERADVHARWPTLSQAHAVFQHDEPQRWEVESRLLAGQPDEVIAASCGLELAVVASYAALFFSLREYLGDRRWLRTKMFGWGAPIFGNKDLGRLWAWTALTGGPYVLDMVLAAFHAMWRKDTHPTLSIYLQPDSQAPLNMQAFIATHVLPQGGKAAVACLAFHARLLEVEAIRDPREMQEAREQLQRDAAAYAFGLLNRTSPRRLQHLLRPWSHGRQGSGHPLSL